MYAVIKTGGKQYKVVAGERLKVEKIVGDVGATVVIDKVLMISDNANTTIGAPLISGATVSATVLSHGRSDKVMIFKFRRRKHYRKTQGHRQSFTEIQIGEILAAGASTSKAAPKATKTKAAKAAE
ncbi:RplU Ribosomal protein L21 [Methylophilaceae bacterium]